MSQQHLVGLDNPVKETFICIVEPNGQTRMPRQRSATSLRRRRGPVPSAQLRRVTSGMAQICFCVNGRLVPTFLPAFQPARSRVALSN